METIDTTIQLEKETRERLKAEKRGGETYDDLVNRLLDIAAMKKK